jgi:hypothetical protein
MRANHAQHRIHLQISSPHHPRSLPCNRAHMPAAPSSSVISPNSIRARTRRRAVTAASPPPPPTNFALHNLPRSAAASSSHVSLLLLPELQQHAGGDMQVSLHIALLTAPRFFTSLQELARLYSPSHARATAARIGARSCGRGWFEDAQAVQLGHVYELRRCSLYRGWSQVP